MHIYDNRKDYLMSDSSNNDKVNDDLLQAIKSNLPELKKLLNEINGEWTYEDGIYRLYHYSYKVYRLQSKTQKIVDTFKRVLNEPLNEMFMTIINEGTGKQFKMEHNQRWLQETRPIVEAFLHGKYFLEMMIKYGEELDYAPLIIPSGWASVLYLYNRRYVKITKEIIDLNKELSE